MSEINAITVQASSPYQVIIGQDLLSKTGDYLSTLVQKNYQKIAVISDSNVAPIYATTVLESLEKSGYSPFLYVFPAGESSKSFPQTERLISWLSEHSFTRSDLLIALGGGVTGDLAGFAASIYLRGCDFVQIPTTLLAAIDSSVGGKTAINIPEGKNLVGAFWQPRLVLCDANTFKTLTSEILSDGIAEIIKYGCIWDSELFAKLETKDWLLNSPEQVIARCIQIKADIVKQDEYDTGIRQVLNFGHTFGHAIESLSELSVSHGKAVSIGMCTVARSLQAQGKLSKNDVNRLEKTLLLYELPIATTYTAKEIACACLADKKRQGNIIHLILLKEIGTYKIFPLSVEKLEDFIQLGL